jgi:signal transduction histidine kinase
VNPRNDTLAHLVDYAGQFALDYLRDAGIRCRFDLPEQLSEREISTDIRHNLFLAVKETLNNIVKHSRATEVWLRIRLEDDGLQLVIEDNGRGFETAPDNAIADGLRNIQQRLVDIDGSCRIESRVDVGTTVIFRVPWKRG